MENIYLKWHLFDQKSRKTSAHIHIPRNNPANFQKYPMDSLGEVVNKGPLYMYMKEMVLGEISPQNEKIPKLK